MKYKIFDMCGDERKGHVALLLFVLLGAFVFYLFHRKRKAERARLMQENIMLKQQEELSNLREKEALLREKDARMREELFKRMNVFEKLSDTEKEKHIQLSDMDWKELQLMLDSGYNGFTQKLRLKEKLGVREEATLDEFLGRMD